MSKWQEDFEKQFKNVGNLKRVTEEFCKDLDKEGYEEIKEMRRRFKIDK